MKKNVLILMIVLAVASLSGCYYKQPNCHSIVIHTPPNPDHSIEVCGN